MSPCTWRATTSLWFQIMIICHLSDSACVWMLYLCIPMSLSIKQINTWKCGLFWLILTISIFIHVHFSVMFIFSMWRLLCLFYSVCKSIYVYAHWKQRKTRVKLRVRVDTYWDSKADSDQCAAITNVQLAAGICSDIVRSITYIGW